MAKKDAIAFFPLSLSLAINTHARFVTLIRNTVRVESEKSLSVEGGSNDPDRLNRYRVRFFAPLFLLCDFLLASYRVASVFINNFDRLIRESIVRLDSK